MRRLPGELDRPLDPRLAESLITIGVNRLYSHQAEAINAIQDGRNVIVATSSASGKSLCYHLPVIEALLADRSARGPLSVPYEGPNTGSVDQPGFADP